MNRITSDENNRKIALDPEDIAVANQIKALQPDLPFDVFQDYILFNQYTVGSMLLGRTLINIECRNKSFTLDKVLQMQLYVQGVKADFSLSEIGEDKKGEISGICVIPYIFLKEVTKLVSKGLTGDYVSQTSQGKIVKGKLILNDYSPKILPIKGVRFQEHIYSNNVPQNQIIKSALLKCLLLSNNSLSSTIRNALKYFDAIDAVDHIDERLLQELKNVHSYNEHYDKCISLAILILKNIAMSATVSGVEWYAFLANSNDLFEAFCRKVLMNNLNAKVEKWDKPKNFASIYFQSSTAYKSFVPDILIGYSSDSESALAVLDAKNKYFEPNKKSISDCVEVADVYEILFYTRQLRTKVGGLIYPSSRRYDPIPLKVIDNGDVDLSLLSVDLSSSINSIETNLVNDVLRTVLRYT